MGCGSSNSKSDVRERTTDSSSKSGNAPTNKNQKPIQPIKETKNEKQEQHQPKHDEHHDHHVDHHGEHGHHADHPQQHEEKHEVHEQHEHREEPMHKVSVEKEKWNYEELGPSSWPILWPQASGSHQSPINIHTDSAVYDMDLHSNPLSIEYTGESCRHVKNAGFTFTVSPNDDNQSNRISGGPLRGSYHLAQFHMHWGSSNDAGSEHLVDDKPYAAEIHFVNWNSHKYQSVQDAVASNNHDALGVLSAFITIGEPNHEIEKILQHLESIQLKNQETVIDSDVELRHLLPENICDYWTYEGSLTTPPCCESVQWIVFKDPIEVSTSQLEKLRNLHSCSDKDSCCEATRVKHNFRPTCELNDRLVKKSFDYSQRMTQMDL